MLSELALEQIQLHDLIDEKTFPAKRSAGRDQQFSDRNGGYSAYGYCWLYEQAELILTSPALSSTSAKLVGRFKFDQLLGDKSARICAVSEFVEPDVQLTARQKFKLLVAVDRSSSGSYLLYVDVRLHKVLRFIECPFKITTIAPVYSDTIVSNQDIFAKELEGTSGLVALGARNGVVTLLDLRLADEQHPLGGCCISNGQLTEPSTINFINNDNTKPISRADIRQKRHFAHINNQLVAISVNSVPNYRGYFNYRFTNKRYKTIRPECAAVTALTYNRMTNTLYVGFWFGGFQGWDLKKLIVDIACELDVDGAMEPVAGFVQQEPENDPRNFIYLWVLRCYQLSDPGNHDMTCRISLYVFEYETREWIANYGKLYSTVISQSIRFEHYLSQSPYYGRIDENTSSNLMGFGVIERGNLFAFRNDDEDAIGLDTSLFYFAWEAVDNASDNIVRFLGLFDLNQYYRAQMPPVLENPNASNFCQYMSFYRLSKLSDLVDDDEQIHTFLDVKVVPQSVQRYEVIDNQQEILYFPCSLSFEVDFLTPCQSARVSFLGLQKKCLSLLRTDSQSIMVEPDDFLLKCIHAGILQQEAAGHLNTPELRRSAVLTLALKNDEEPFLLQTIQNWATGEFDQYGCTCKFFLEWLWEQVVQTKEAIDNLVQLLFDFSIDQFDKEHLNQLRTHRVTLKSVQLLLKNLINCGAPSTEQGVRELMLRHQIVQYILDYLLVICWFYYADLLRSRELDINWEDVYSQLAQKYEKRRHELGEMDTGVEPDQILMIDALIKHSPTISDLWEEHGSGRLYPPSNMHSIISIYLLDSVSIELKNQLMYYHLYDLMEVLRENNADITDRLYDFPRYFALRVPLTRLVKAMYALDNENYELAMSLLQSSSIQLTFPNDVDDHTSLKDDLQVRICRSLLFKDYVLQALRFMNSSLFACDSLVKEKLYIKALMRSSNIASAYRFQKEHRTQASGDQIMLQFFYDCDERNLFDKLFMFSLDQIEEEALIYYLLDYSNTLKSHFMLIIYFILNEKLFDAAKVLQGVEADIPNIKDEDLYAKALEIKELVGAYFDATPPQLVKIGSVIDELNTIGIANSATQSKRKKNTPLRIKNDDIIASAVRTPISGFVKQLLNKIGEIDGVPVKSTQAGTPFKKKIEMRGLLVAQSSPFLRRKSLCIDESKTPLRTLNSQFVYFNKTDQPHIAFPNESINHNFTNLATRDMDISMDTSLSQNHTTKAKRNFSNNLLSVLHTPNVKKGQRSMLINDSIRTENLTSATPASILKVGPSKSRDNETLRFDLSNDDSSLNLTQTPSKSKSKSNRAKKEKEQPNQPQVSKKATESFKFQLEGDEDEERASIDERASRDSNNSELEPHKVEIGEFRFSKTDQIKGAIEQPELAIDVTPTKMVDYVFSPPVTRSRKKKVAGVSRSEALNSKEDTTAAMDITFDEASAQHSPALLQQTAVHESAKKSTKKGTPKRGGKGKK